MNHPDPGPVSLGYSRKPLHRYSNKISMNQTATMTLSEDERQVLRILEFSGEVPYATLSEQLDMSPKKFGKIVQHLEQQGVLSALIPIVNPWKLGHQYFGMRFTTAFHVSMSDVIQAFTQTPGVVWFETSSGAYDFNTTLCTPSIHRVASFLAGLGTIYENFFSARTFYYPYEVILYGKRFLYPDLSIDPIRISDTQSPMEYTDQDLKLLRTIATNVPSMRDIAEHIEMSASAISRRLLQYEEQQVILSYERYIRLQACGYTTRVGAFTFNSLGPNVQQRLEQFAEEHLPISFMIKTVGDTELFLGMEVDSPHAFVSLKESFLQTFSKHLRSASWYEHLSIEKASYF